MIKRELLFQTKYIDANIIASKIKGPIIDAFKKKADGVYDDVPDEAGIYIIMELSLLDNNTNN